MKYIEHHIKKITVNTTLIVLLLVQTTTTLQFDNFHYQTEVPTSYEDTINLHLKSFNLVEEANTTTEEPHKNSLQNKQLSENQARQLMFQLLIDKSIHKDMSTNILDKTLLQKMEIFCGGSKPSINLFSIINRTKTMFGQAALLRLLAQPTTDATVLRKRQAIIEELVNNEALFNSLEATLDQIKQVENSTFVFWDKENQVNETLLKSVFFSINKLNKNATALEIAARLSNLSSLSWILDIPFISLLSYLKVWATPNKSSVLKAFASSFIDTIKSYKFILDPRLKTFKHLKTFDEIKSRILASTIEDINFFFKGQKLSFNEQAELAMKFLAENFHLATKPETLRDFFANLTLIPDKYFINFDLLIWDLFLELNTKLNLVPSKYLGSPSFESTNQNNTKSSDNISSQAIKRTLWGGLGLYALIKFSTMYRTIKHELLKKNICNSLQEKMIDVATYINSIKQMSRLAIENDTLNDLPCLNHLKKLTNPSREHSKGFNKLVNFLDKNTFKGNPSFFSLTGRVLASYKLMLDVKDEFIPAMEAAGEIDAYLSIAKLYKEFRTQPVKYSFVNFDEDSETPYVQAEDFWNPFINPNEVVPNSIKLGTNNSYHLETNSFPNNVILTGPNTSGKSTVIKALIINLLLAQTLGIAPAQSLTITPLTRINCYLNITDDIAVGTSLFEAEALRAKALINSIQTLQDKDFSFTIMDEVFSGTSPTEGEEAAYLYAERLGKFNNSILIIATHFPKLTSLENAEEEQQSYKNYRVQVIQKDNGSIERLYKLEEGTNTINIVKNLLMERGVL